MLDLEIPPASSPPTSILLFVCLKDVELALNEENVAGKPFGLLLLPTFSTSSLIVEEEMTISSTGSSISSSEALSLNNR